MLRPCFVESEKLSFAQEAASSVGFDRNRECLSGAVELAVGGLRRKGSPSNTADRRPLLLSPVIPSLLRTAPPSLARSVVGRFCLTNTHFPLTGTHHRGLPIGVPGFELCILVVPEISEPSY